MGEKDPEEKRGTVAIAYDCGGSMRDNCNWGNVSGVSWVRVDGGELALERMKQYRARRPRGCGE